jgi:hypothetical protein
MKNAMKRKMMLQMTKDLSREVWLSSFSNDPIIMVLSPDPVKILHVASLLSDGGCERHKADTGN